MSAVRVLHGNVKLSLAQHRAVSVQRLYVHPLWTWNVDPVSRVDMAWFQLSLPLQLTADTRPIALAQPSDTAFYAAGLAGTVTGWGFIAQPNAGSFLPPVPDTLHSVQQALLSQAQCNTVLNNTGRLPSITPDYLCAGSEGLAACTGDSGSALTATVGGVTKQIGIVSRGTVSNAAGGLTCGSSGEYSVYTRVDASRALIVASTNETFI